MKKIIEFVTGTMGALGCLGFNVLLLFSFPLTVLALMHLFGMPWWKAIIVAVLGGAIPIVGQIGYIILTVMGAYYLIHAGFDWGKAAEYQDVSDMSADTEHMTAAQFETYKQTVILPVFKAKCAEEMKRRNSNAEASRVEAVCDCYVNKSTEGMTPAEMKNESPNPEREIIVKRASLACAMQ